MKFSYKYLLPLLLIFFACRKEIPQLNEPDKYRITDFNQMFEAFWTGMNNNYVFWDIDTVNWDQMYRIYKPKFASLGRRDSPLAYAYLKEMTAGLIDHHYTIEFAKGLGLETISPSWDRKLTNPEFHIPIRGEFVASSQKYLDTFITAEVTADVTVNRRGVAVVSGIIPQKILYFHLTNFFLLDNIDYVDPDGVATLRSVMEYFFDNLTRSDLKGVIIDVRGNSGGDLRDLNFLLGRMINKPLFFGYTRSKSGNGRLDYSPWAPAFARPHRAGHALSVPIVVLTDANSVSMSEITAMAVKALPNGHIVGERTWGGMGPLTDNENFNGGQFCLDNFISLVHTSSLMFKYKDGNIYEGIGFPPDVTVPYNRALLDAGKDPQLEKAIEIIH